MTLKKFGEWEAALAASFVAQFEGCKLKAYRCPAGVWTIGFGHTQGVKEGDTITEEDALILLTDELGEFAAKIAPLVRAEVTEGQFVALLSFAYNIGVDNLKRSSVLRNLNNGAITAAADAFLLWNRAGGKVLAGLSRRRRAERKLFLS